MYLFSFFPPSSLTETIEGLQTHMEELQTQVDKLKTAQADRDKRELAEQRRSLGAQSVSCLKELYDLHHDRYYIYVCYCPHCAVNSRTTECDKETIFREEVVWYIMQCEITTPEEFWYIFIENIFRHMCLHQIIIYIRELKGSWNHLNSEISCLIFC